MNLLLSLTRIFYCRIMVRLGELDVRTERDCNADGSSCIEAQDFEIDKITAHSMYDTPKYANDIALIRLKRMTNSSKEIGYNLISQKKKLICSFPAFISPLCLPVDKYLPLGENLTGTQGIIAGWGSMTAGTIMFDLSLDIFSKALVKPNQYAEIFTH